VAAFRIEVMAVWDDRAKLIVRAGVSGAVLGAAMFVLLHGGYSDSSEKWAIGAIGIVLGYWLR
jgi:hypothetical protein